MNRLISVCDASGIPARFYRDPEEIKADIRAVSAKISEINEMLNIRELLAEFLGEGEETPIGERAESLGELLQYALEALDELRELDATLDELKSELLGSLTAVGGCGSL